MSKKKPRLIEGAKYSPDDIKLGYTGDSTVDAATYYAPHNPFQLSEKEEIWLAVEEIEKEKEENEQGR